jgi:hypothetical protein
MDSFGPSDDTRPFVESDDLTAKATDSNGEQNRGIQTETDVAVTAIREISEI